MIHIRMYPPLQNKISFDFGGDVRACNFSNGGDVIPRAGHFIDVDLVGWEISKVGLEAFLHPFPAYADIPCIMADEGKVFRHQRHQTFHVQVVDTGYKFEGGLLRICNTNPGYSLLYTPSQTLLLGEKFLRIMPAAIFLPV